MSVFEHNHRSRIYNAAQHPYKHTLSDFAYTNPALPGVSELNSALDWLFAVLYPNTQDSVATVGDLPSSGNTLYDYRVVLDDGDGKAASYRWELREGDVAAQWYKIYDMDWGEDTILSNFLLKTQDMYVYQYGIDNIDETGAVITGDLGGQHIYGGQSAGTHLTLFANSGDGTGPNTGYVQVGDNFRPLADSTYSSGTDTYRWANVYTDSLTSGTMTVTSGSITDSSGTISFVDENLVTTGTMTVGTASTLVLNAGSITDSSGAISFGDETLTTTGNLNAATAGFTQLNVDNIRIDGNTISSTDTDGNIILSPDGTGVINALKDTNVTGFLYASNYVQAGTPGTETAGIDINGTTYAARLRANEIGGTEPAQLMLHRHSTTLPAAMVGSRANDDTSSHAAVTNGMNLLRIYGAGYTGTHYDLFGAISIDADGTGTIGATSSPGRIQLLVTADGANTPTVAMSIYNDKSVALAGSLDVATTLTVDTIDDSGAGDITLLKTIHSSGNDLGKTGALWADLWLSGNIQDGTNTFAISDLMTFRAVGTPSPGDALFWDGSKWAASAPDTEIDHGTVSGLGDDDHTQYMLLAGRSGGQDLIGGTAAGNNLTLESTSNASKGAIRTKDNFIAHVDASYSAGWSGTDLGGASNRFRHLYMAGEAFGFRAENRSSDDTPSVQNVGRIWWNTTEGKMKLDTGTAIIPVGSIKHTVDTSWNGSDTSKVVDVSSSGIDATNAIWQLKDNSNDYEIVFCTIKATATDAITISVGTALPAGSYRLIGLE